jgi:hypothetical protein
MKVPLGGKRIRVGCIYIKAKTNSDELCVCLGRQRQIKKSCVYVYEGKDTLRRVVCMSRKAKTN